MQVIVHTGAHNTDEDRLMKCLLRNKQSLSEGGVAVPGPGKYRELLAQSFRAMSEGEPAADAREVLLDAILDDETADRMILSNPFFFGAKRIAVIDGLLYPTAPERVAHLQKLFSGDQVRVFLALRNPASFLPAVLGTTTPATLKEVMGGRDPRELRWSETLNRIRATAPDVQLTVWCHEDSPLIWGPIIRDMAGLQPGEKIVGAFDLLAEIMSSEGMQKFRAYLHQHPRLSESQKRDVTAVFLERFGIPELLEEELDLPGWTDELVADMTEIYDADVERIQSSPGVSLILP